MSSGERAGVCERSDGCRVWTCLDSGEALLRAVLDRAPAALGQVTGAVLGLGLHQDLQLLPFTLHRVLLRQHPAFLAASLMALRRAAGRNGTKVHTGPLFMSH